MLLSFTQEADGGQTNGTVDGPLSEGVQGLILFFPFHQLVVEGVQSTPEETRDQQSDSQVGHRMT
jgi:hypothetical protein